MLERKNRFKLFRDIGLGIMFSVLIMEMILQTSFFFEIGLGKKPILFFNPYCDQQYWTSSSSQGDVINQIYHPILSLQQDSLRVPNDFTFNNDFVAQEPSKDLIFYGSSFIGHDLFKEINDTKFKTLNYGVSSYGLDQIYLSYKLTKNFYENKTIVIGFLLEDLDRSIFTKRDYEKVKLTKKNDVFTPSNIPITLNATKNDVSFYLYRLAKNSYQLASTNFAPKNSTCLIDQKKELFKFMIDDLVNDAKLLDQNLIFVTFNFINDFQPDSVNWREDFMFKFFEKNNLEFINSKEVFKNYLLKTDESIESLFSEGDMHYSKIGFQLVHDELNYLQSDISKR